MPTYEYQDLVSGEVVEVQQRISDPVFTHRIGDKLVRAASEASAQLAANLVVDDTFTVVPPEQVHPVKRLISAESGGFRLVSGPSGSWGSGGYSKTLPQRKAEHVLGRKCIKRAE